MGESRNQLIHDITSEWLNDVDTDNPPSAREIQDELISEVNSAIITHNATVTDKRLEWQTINEMTASQIAQVIRKLHDICIISFTDDASDDSSTDIAIYQTTGDDRGIYVTNPKIIRGIIRRYDRGLTDLKYKDIISSLKDIAPIRLRNANPDLVPVNNGIFDYKNKVLMDFDPDYVFTYKSCVDYNPSASNVVIHNNEDNTDWDVESWMNELSDDAEVVKLLWEVMGAVLRPRVSWDKTVWFYSTKGNNGKGTLCQLMRNLCGEKNCASIQLSKLDKDSLLEKLLRSMSIIADENDNGTFIDKAAHLKEIATNDVITIDRKYKTSISFRFYGLMIQCLNELPRIKDKSDSLYRRELLVPFDKCFTGCTRDYIKSDYIKRQDVLEYILYKLLNTNYYKLSEPAVCARALAEHKGYNDPLRQFVEEILPECKWDLLPWTFLYDLYKAWFRQNVPMGSPQGSRTFVMNMKDICDTLSDWMTTGNGVAKSASHMAVPEPLIAEYGLTKWMNSTYKGNDVDKICTPDNLKITYKGLLRV